MTRQPPQSKSPLPAETRDQYLTRIWRDGFLEYDDQGREVIAESAYERRQDGRLYHLESGAVSTVTPPERNLPPLPDGTRPDPPAEPYFDATPKPVGVIPPLPKLRIGAKPFILHPDGRRQAATEDEVRRYVETGQLP